MDGAPEHEGPTCAVPDAADGEDDQAGGNGSVVVAKLFPYHPFPDPVGQEHVVERRKEVVPQPRGEGDVPAAPEVGEGVGLVGGVEVLGDGKAEHEANADGHVGVGAEVEVDLQGVGEESVPCVERADGGRVEAGIGDLAAGVGKEDLLGESQAHE